MERVSVEYGAVQDPSARVVELLKEVKVLAERQFGGKGKQTRVKVPRFFMFVYDLYKLGLPMVELVAYANSAVKRDLPADYIVKVIEVMHGLELAGLTYVKSEEKADIMALIKFRQVEVDPRILGTMAKVVYGVLGQGKRPYEKALDIVTMFRMFPSVFTPYEHVMYSAYVDYILYFDAYEHYGYYRVVGRRWIPYTPHLDSFFKDLMTSEETVREIIELRHDLPTDIREKAERMIDDLAMNSNGASLAWLINKGVLSEASMSRLAGLAESTTMHLASSLANSLLSEVTSRRFRVAEPQELEKTIEDLHKLTELAEQLDRANAQGDLVEQGIEFSLETD